jgi:hypothetical protein
MKKLLIIAGICVFGLACGNKESEKKSDRPEKEGIAENGNPSYDPNRGEGKFTSVDIGTGIDEAMATAGEKVYGVKCSGCHKTTEEKLVGPGWKGVTSRHQPIWIMNFVTNTDEMLNKDPKAQAQLEICLVRMPNQNLTDDDARHILEFMRKNDAAK